MLIAENVYMLECTKHSHAYLIKAEENILIDTSMPGLAKQMLSELQSLGVAPASLSTILLTHHDIDHIGNAKRLQTATGAKLWAPEADMPYITGALRRPNLKGIFQAILRPETPVVSGTYAANQRFGEVQPIFAPGHTPGHTIFLYRKVLFAGDLLGFSKGRFLQAPSFMNSNENERKQSLAALKQIDFEWLCPAHGEPIPNDGRVKEYLAGY